MLISGRQRKVQHLNIRGEENIFLGRKRKTEKEKEESFWRRRIYVLLAEEGKNGEWSIYRCFKGS